MTDKWSDGFGIERIYDPVTASAEEEKQYVQYRAKSRTLMQSITCHAVGQRHEDEKMEHIDIEQTFYSSKLSRSSDKRYFLLTLGL